MRLLAAGIALSLMLGACGDRQGARDAIPLWSLESTPVLAVGDIADTDSAVFSRVTDARLLETGMLAVADGGARAVIFFDATGQERARLGRRGRGPGEFNGSMTLAGLGADSLAVWDPGQPRWTLITGETPAFSADAPPTTSVAWIHAGAMVRGERALVPEWAPPLLMALSDSLAELRFGFVDETALLWVNTDAEGREWRAYAGPAAVGRITLPAETRPTQFRADRVVGVRTDSLGLEQVVVHRFSRPEGIVPGRGAATPPAPDAQARGELIAAMRTAVVAQEMHYAQASSYTTRTDSLAVTMPPGARLKVLDADTRSWRGVGWYAATGYSCGMMVGGVPPRGWREGEARCGW